VRARTTGHPLWVRRLRRPGGGRTSSTVQSWQRFDGASGSGPGNVAEVEEQDLGFLPRRERDCALGGEAGAIACGQDDVAQHHLALHEVEPRASPWRKLVNHVLAGAQQGRVHEGVLVDAQRSSPGVGRCDDAQSVPALRCAEAFLLLAGLEPCLRRAQPDLEDVRPVRPRCIPLAVENAAPGGHAMELARMDDT
jgi:hypothetical protein